MSKKKKSNKKSSSNKAILIGVAIAIIALIIVFVSLNGKDTIADQNNNISSQNEKESSTEKTSSTDGVTIIKSDITEKASFYPYKSGKVEMEVLAIRASDGTVRTAFNTCQVCQGSGRAYYVQDGDVVIWQNCGNRFTVDQVEVVKGGCNPIPIFEDSKTQDDEKVFIPANYLDENKQLFNNWKS